MLTYPEAFRGRIRPHKDMNPRMAIDPMINSQIVGSSVIVVSFFSAQEFKMCQQRAVAGTSYAYDVKDSFLLQHCSVYVLDPRDDIEWHHTAEFPRPIKVNGQRMRVALTLRWLGNQQQFLCEDYNGARKHCQAVGSPRTVIKKMASRKRQELHFQTT